MNIFKLFISSYITVFLIFNIWAIGYSYYCIVIIVPIIFFIVIGFSFIEIQLQKRECFKNCYFISNSFIAKLLSSKVLTIIFYISASVIMSISALYSLIDLKVSWIYIFIYIGIILFVYKFLLFLFSKVFKVKYLNIFSRELTINITSLMMIFIYIYVTIYSFEPFYIRDSFEDTLRVASNSIHSNCTIINSILKLQKEIDSIYWWLIHQGTININDSIYKIAIWIIFLFINSFSILGLNRFMAQIIYLLDKLFVNQGNYNE